MSFAASLLKSKKLALEIRDVSNGICVTASVKTKAQVNR